MTRLTLYTKSGCHLCDKMKTLISRLRNEFIFDYEEVDIENNNGLYEKYKEKIPVLFVNGKIFAKYKLDEKKMKRKFTDNSKS